ncbi:MAG: hypothetical protein SPL00_04330 [Bacilli bacterium]|nr:hypothetical protein [Bacilli bacterium]
MKVAEGNPSIRKLRKWKKQRAERGFSDYDVYNIDYWFLSIIPEMLDELIKHNEGFPSFLEEEYYEENNLNLSKISDSKRREILSICLNKWRNILTEMRDAFKEAKEDSCSYKNKYEEEYDSLYEKFFRVYGHSGEKLKDNVKEEYIKNEKGKVIETYYSPIKKYKFQDVSEENKRISDLYHKEEKKIEGYRESNRKKALEMFSKYLENLWW